MLILLNFVEAEKAYAAHLSLLYPFSTKSRHFFVAVSAKSASMLLVPRVAALGERALSGEGTSEGPIFSRCSRLAHAGRTVQADADAADVSGILLADVRIVRAGTLESNVNQEI